MATLCSISRFLLLLTSFAFFQYSVISLPNGTRWYQMKDNHANMGSRVKPHFDYLHKSGCCEDRVECRAKNGDRIFKSVEASAAFKDPNEVNGSIIYSLVFGNIFTAHQEIEDQTLNPVFRGLSYIPKAYTLRDKLFRYKFADGYKVRAWMLYKNMHIFVCSLQDGDHVLIKSNWTLPGFWINKATCLQDTRGHPAMCEQNLIELIAIPGPGGKTTVVAYIDKMEGMDVYGKRTVDVKVWKDKVADNSTLKYESRVSSIDWYRIDGNIVHGIYFTTDAFVCRFEFDLGKGDLKPDHFQFDKEDFCRPMSVYLVCPQGWCYELGMTTSFTIEGNDGFYYVYFTKSLWHWRVKTRKIPMSVPRVEDALYYGSGLQNIWFEGTKYKGIDVNAPYPPIMIFDATAAFRIEHDQRNFTFSYTGRWNFVPDDNPKRGSKGNEASNWREIEGVGNRIQLELFGDIKPEAAYFDDNERKLYLFEGSQYTVFQVKEGARDISMNVSWKQVEGPQSVSVLKFEEGTEIKEVIALGDNLNFVINATHFYHSVGNIRQTQKVLKFSFTELFRVQSECYYNDYREYKKTLDMYGVILPEETVSERKYDSQYMKIGEPSSTWGISAILVIIGLGAAIALAALLAMFLFGRVRRRTETKIVKKYSSQMSGIKDRKLSKEPISKSSPAKERRLSKEPSKEPSKFKFSKLKMRNQR